MIRVMQIFKLKGHFPPSLIDHLTGIVRRAVVHHDNLEAGRFEILLGEVPQRPSQGVRAIIRGDHDAQSKILAHNWNLPSECYFGKSAVASPEQLGYLTAKLAIFIEF
jgi:hypothetical protein